MPPARVEFSDERLPNGLRLIVAEDHLAPVVAINLWYDVGSKHEVPGKTGFAHLFEHVMFQGSRARREGRAHRARPGRRRHDQRHDLARPHELLRDAAVAPARARALARGRPDGDAPRRAEPGEPRQPARGRQEREALVVRQPAVRLVEREAPGAPVPAGAPVPPPDDRLDGGPRRGVARGRERVLPDLLRARTTRSLSVVGDVDRPRCAAAPSATSAAIPANPIIPPLGDLSLPPTLGEEVRETVPDRVPLPRVYFGFRAPRFGDPRSTRSRWPARSSPAARAAGCTGGWSATSGSRRTWARSRSASSAARRSRPAG